MNAIRLKSICEWDTLWLGVMALLMLLMLDRSAVCDDDTNQSVVRVALYADDGVTKKELPEVEHCLATAKGFNVKSVTAKDIRDGRLDEFDVVIHPGGSASKQAETLSDEGREQVRRFVKEGGGFIGICAGAYLASASYPWSLALLDARVVDGEHWARGQGEVQLRLPREGRTAFALDEETCPIFYNQGPLLAPGEKDDIPDYELLAAFETEIAKNGAPTGVMKGTTAIARGKFGDGRVVCFSPHPEKTPGREAFVREAVRWAAGRD